MESRVCIILVNYNGTTDTIECVKSLLHITYSEYKIIVIDNGSTEKLEVMEHEILQDERVIVIDIDNNLGFAGGNNYAIDYCKKMYDPEFYLLLNNDTVVKENFLLELVTTAHNWSNIGIVTGKIYLFSKPDEFWYAGGALDLNTGWTSHFGAKEKDNGQYDVDREVTFASGCLWLLPRDTIESIGLMRTEYFLYYEDADYCYRVSEKGKKIVYCHNSAIFHKVNGSTKKISDSERYYMVRNGLYFTELYVGKKMRVKLLHLWQYTKDVLKKRMRIKTFIRAYLDYKRHSFGKM